MVTALRILFLVFVLSTFLMNLGWRKRVIVLSVSGLLMVVATILTISLSGRPTDDAEFPIRTVAVAPPVATRPPKGPSFESACDQFRLVVRDIDTGRLAAFAERKERMDEIRDSATFAGSPASFLDLINTYSHAVDQKLGIDSTSAPPALINETDAEALDRAIRRARDDMLSECRARQG